MGAKVRIATAEQLSAFKQNGTRQPPLDESQLEFAGTEDKVTGFSYNNGDIVYRLERAPGMWHEELLAPMNRYGPLPKRLEKALSEVEPSWDGKLPYFPCRVVLNNGDVIDTVYIEPEEPFLRYWGSHPEKPWSIDIEDIAEVADSSSRLPAGFATELYRAGESGMGYEIFTVVFTDGLRQAWGGGSAVDFIRYPPGKGPADVAQVIPHEGRNDPNIMTRPRAHVCLYSARGLGSSSESSGPAPRVETRLPTMDERAVQLAVEYLEQQFARGEPADLPGMLMHVDAYERVVMVREEIDEMLRRSPSVCVTQSPSGRIIFTQSSGDREISDEDLARNIQMYRDDFAAMEERSDSRWKNYKIDKAVLAARQAALELRRKGLECLAEGRPGEAERYFREALATPKLLKSDRVRPLVSLGDSLMDQARYPEAEKYFAKALDEGDATGSAQGSMADLLLIQGSDPRRALQFTEYAWTLGANRPPKHKLHALLQLAWQVTYWSRKAQALVQLGRQSEAQDAVGMALKTAEGWEAAERACAAPAPAERASAVPQTLSADRMRAWMNWRVANALVAIGEPAKALEYFRAARDADPKGKIRLLADQQIRRIESA